MKAMLASIFSVTPTMLLQKFEFGLGVIILLGGVIAIHELGHFLCAKFVGARVDVFSIGFGPKLFRKVWHGTEYCLSLVPLGGYVKIYGQDPDELKDDPNPDPSQSLAHKGLWQRILVYVGGPGFNFILAILIFTVLAFIGIKKNPSIAVRIVAESPAYQSGLRSGDKIVNVDGTDVKTFEELYTKIAEYPGKTVPMTVVRGDNKKDLNVQIDKAEAYTPYGEPVISGYLTGLEFFARAAVVATTKEQNELGLKHGDLIKKINDVEINSWEDVENYFHDRLFDLPRFFSIEVVRNGTTMTVKSDDFSYLQKIITPNWNVLGLMDRLGLHSTELFIKEVKPGTPAEKAGLQVNDRIQSVARTGEQFKRVHSFTELQNRIQDIGKAVTAAAGDKGKPDFTNAVQLKIVRDGQLKKLGMSLDVSERQTQLGDKILNYTIGILSQITTLDVGTLYAKDMVTERTNNPIYAVASGFQKTGEFTVHTVVGLKKIVFGEVSMKAVGGPIMIAKIGGETLVKRGIRQFLIVMAVISITLGIVNLLPIPVLDGGHVMFALIESIRGKPLSQAAMQWSLKVGVTFLITLMFFAVYNDISRINLF